MDKKSTYDRMMQNPDWSADFISGYEEFLISETLIEMMNEQKFTVKSLAERAGVSTTTIQNIKKGSAKNMKLKTIIPVLSVLGCKLKLEKNANHS